jgi:hypothetical protein
MIIRRMRIACRITKGIDTNSGYVIPIAFPLQQWLYERAAILRYTYITCRVPCDLSVDTQSLQDHVEKMIKPVF